MSRSISFPYEDVPPVKSFPRRTSLGVFSPSSRKPENTPESLIRKAFSSPFRLTL